jgi:hypothetical protein
MKPSRKLIGKIEGFVKTLGYKTFQPISLNKTDSGDRRISYTFWTMNADNKTEPVLAITVQED